MTYFEKLERVKNDLVRILHKRGIQERYLRFGGAGDKPARIGVPTDARSEFLANRAMGDWAENILAAATSRAAPEWQVTRYGNTETIAAGESGFKQLYLAGLEEVRRFGKRPDLLIFPKELGIADNLSTEPFERVDPIVPHALAAIEVRSSKFEALKYMAVRAAEKENGKRGGRDSPSFTVKVEDLKIVYRWIERYKKPQSYLQVFFDTVFAINVMHVFEIIGSGAGFTIETPEKSQEKATIMVPITNGVKVGRFSTLPTFRAAERVTRLGRHDAYVIPEGGELTINRDALKTVLLPVT